MSDLDIYKKAGGPAGVAYLANSLFESQNYYIDKEEGRLVLLKAEGLNEFLEHWGIPREGFSMPVTIGPECVGEHLFKGCAGFNCSVRFPKELSSNIKSTSYKGMFEDCTRLNTAIYIPEGVTNCDCMFRNCTYFDMSVVISSTVRRANMMFMGCRWISSDGLLQFSHEGSLTECSAIFAGCCRLNNIINGFPDSVQYLSGAFAGCEELGHTIKIPISAKHCESMFLGCRALKGDVVIPDEVVNTAYMFSGCVSFDGKVILPRSLEDATGMFNDCINLHTQVVFPDEVSFNMKDMFRNDSLYYKNNYQQLKDKLTQSQLADAFMCSPTK